jgi:hypothetical protein
MRKYAVLINSPYVCSVTVVLKQINDKRIQPSFDAMMLPNQYLMWDLEYDIGCINEDLNSGSSAFHLRSLVLKSNIPYWIKVKLR